MKSLCAWSHYRHVQIFKDKLPVGSLVQQMLVLQDLIPDALSTRSMPLCSLDCSLSGSFVHGILQARILEWVAFPFSRGFSQPRDQTQVSCNAGAFFTS